MNTETNEKTSKLGASDSVRYLSFTLGEEEYAVPLLSVKEVIAMPEITPIPHTQPHFLGIMNLRGQIVSVIDLRMKLGMKPKQGSETAVIICELSPINIGVVVDSVDSVIPLSPSQINQRPEIQASRNSDYIVGVTEREKNLILLLDIAKALDVADYTNAKNAANKAA